MVAAGLLVIANDVVQAPNDKQQMQPMLGKVTPRHSSGSTSASPAISCGIRPPQPQVGAGSSISAAQEPPHDAGS
jgi:hypothetical protein